MAATVVPPAPQNTQTNLEKIESFMKDSAYEEILQNSVNYNTRLCIERRLRLPFIDTQTGVAQNHCALFMHRRQRIPGLLPGQIYTYPRQRWRKKRRQYLTMNSRAYQRAADAVLDGDIDMHNISQIENPALQDTDSKDSQLLKDEVSKEWFYDEADMLEMDQYDEPDPDSDLDYEETYKRSRKRKTAGRGRGVDSPSTPGRRKGGGRGRKKAGGHSFDPTPGDPDKPFACERTPSRRGRQSNAPPPQQQPPPPQVQLQPPPQHHHQAPPNLAPNLPPHHQQGPPPSAIMPPHMVDDPPMPVLMPEKMPDGPGPLPPPPHLMQPQHHGHMPPPHHAQHMPPEHMMHPHMHGPPPPHGPPQHPGMPPMGPHGVPHGGPPPPHQQQPQQMPPQPPHVEKKAAPSPYCDFCLGDSRENKKTGGTEELVSCSDCGRSGHPSCLQFTANMKISVKKYRWQCIECKCCSVCGTSDNDDQLLFCDDCDRGYHMYCLSPPLVNPPEGSWSCKLCIEQFHK